MKHLLLLSALAISVLFNEPEGSLAFTVDGTREVVKRPASTLYLNEVSHNTAKGTVKIRVTIFPAGSVLDFTVVDKGTTKVVHYTPSFGEVKVAATYMRETGHNLYGENVSVTIGAVDAAHVAGTFSGKFANNGQSVTITDGSFDLPMHAKK